MSAETILPYVFVVLEVSLALCLAGVMTLLWLLVVEEVLEKFRESKRGR